MHWSGASTTRFPGIGREGVVTIESALKIRAEDGRYVEKVDLSPFIRNLPLDRETGNFSTENASGSTSQAAGIVEALEMGCRLLLMDEDTSATNFIIRDARMQALVAKPKEPITPFIDKVRQMFRDYGVSTILVMGGSGDYFDVADSVVMMDEYRPLDVSADARSIVAAQPSRRCPEGGDRFGRVLRRRPRARSFDASRGRRAVKIDARGLRKLSYGRADVDLSALEQLVDSSQTRAIGLAIHHMATRYFGDDLTLEQALDRLMEDLDAGGLEILSPFKVGNLARPRRYEVAMAVNRMRTLSVRGLTGSPVGSQPAESRHELGPGRASLLRTGRVETHGRPARMMPVQCPAPRGIARAGNRDCPFPSDRGQDGMRACPEGDSLFFWAWSVFLGMCFSGHVFPFS